MLIDIECYVGLGILTGLQIEILGSETGDGGRDERFLIATLVVSVCLEDVKVVTVCLE